MLSVLSDCRTTGLNCHLVLMLLLLLQVSYLTVADFSMREELVLKIAILAEKFAPNVQVGDWHGMAG
jgi:hypothetical protein